ncbi:MAG: S53 family peptidase [Trebonia sp.]
MRDLASRKHRVRITLAACVTAVTAAALAASAAGSTAKAGTASPARQSPASGMSTAQVTVRPGAIRLPGAATQAPASTADCEQLDGIACFDPDQLRAAYQLPPLYAKGITGTGATIMIVDSFGSPTIKADLAAFDRQFGYRAPPNFTIIAPAGKIPPFNPASTDMDGWAGETTLDVEYAHALAPGANILLVETPVSETEGVTGFPQIMRAEEYALAHYKVGVISQSFSATEETFTSYAQLDPLRVAYKDADSSHVTVLAASGDAGATDYQSDQVNYYTSRVTSWPDSDPLVTAVGGTQLRPQGAGYTSVAWNDTYDRAWTLFGEGSTDPSPVASGGGTSEFFARPAYQDGVEAVTGARRGVPDIAMSAACDGSVSVYSSYQPGQAGWSLTCGTSEATPEFAAIVALADQVAGHPLGLINPALYRLEAEHAQGIVDVTSGNNSVSFDQGTSPKPVTVAGYPARQGYDLVSGVGTVNAEQFVYELAALGNPEPPDGQAFTFRKLLAMSLAVS